MTKTLIWFINDIKDYNPIFTYRAGKKWVIVNAFSRWPGNREQGELANTHWFLSISDFPISDASEQHSMTADADASHSDEPPKKNHQSTDQT